MLVKVKRGSLLQDDKVYKTGETAEVTEEKAKALVREDVAEIVTAVTPKQGAKKTEQEPEVEPEKPQVAEKAKEEPETPASVDLEELTKAELLEEATKRDIEVPIGANKDEIKKLLK